MRNNDIQMDPFPFWPNCAVPGCKMKSCLKLDSKFCFPHTGIFGKDRAVSRDESEEMAFAA